MSDDQTYPLGRRITIYGNSGSGKTTVGRELAGRLGVAYIELDAVFHYRPNWEDLPAGEFRHQVRELLARHRDGWVIDGNYGSVRDLILAEADTAIWLKLPFRVVYPRLVWRTVKRSVRHSPLWNGNRETLKQTFLSKDSMLLWGITAWRRSRVATAEALAAAPSLTAVHILTSTRAVDRLLASVPPYEPGSVSTSGSRPK